ncbi:MAG TPA: acyltransferase [Opitutae bacterium]|nr:acyltransferase [Opitutae bacterium]
MLESFRYRAEIDGLRAVAVVAVVLYHAGIGLSGGYVGVDVFFVISGFLITSLIVKDIQDDRFSMLDFWERRARRILPASIFMALSVAVLGWFLLLPSDFVGFARSLISQATFVSNIYFWKSTGYFAGAAEEMPLLHTWSLSVEEQFYMVVPCLLFFLFRLFKSRGLTAVRYVIGVGLFASLVLSIYVTSRMPSASFYLLPPRAWELLCGSFIALVPMSWVPRRIWLRELLVTLGLCAIVFPCFLYSEKTLFPGLAALPPCIGALLVILGSAPVGTSTRPIVARILATRPIVFIGLISYSLYLWHWPLFAFLNYWQLEPLGFLMRVSLVVFSFILAVLSWWFVETPFRKKAIAAKRSQIFQYSGASAVLLILLGLYISLQNGVPDRYSADLNKIDRVRSQDAWSHLITDPLSLEQAQCADLPLIGEDNAKIQLLVWGDSHARSILPAIATLALDEGVAVATAWNSSTPPLLDYVPRGETSKREQSPLIAQALVEYVGVHQIPVVLLSAQWSGYFEGEEGRFGAKRINVSLEDAMVQTIVELKKAGARVWIMEEVPRHHADVPDALTRQEFFGSDIVLYCGSRQSHRELNANFDSMRLRFERAGASVLDISDLLYDESAGHYKMQESGSIYYFDDNHVTPSGAAQLLPAFVKLFH